VGKKELTKYVPPSELFKQIEEDTREKREALLAQREVLLQETYEGLHITPELAKKFQRHLAPLKHGLSAAVPLMCLKDRCPFYDSCKARVFNMDELYGKPCIVELVLLQHKKSLYAKEFNLEEDDYGSFILVDELAELDIYDFRATMSLSIGERISGTMEEGEKNIAQALLQNIAHFDEMGNITHYTQDIHAAFLLKERLKNRKLKLLDLLVATRKEQYKRDAALRLKSDSSIANEHRNITARIDRLTKEIRESKTTPDSYREFIDKNVG